MQSEMPPPPPDNRISDIGRWPFDAPSVISRISRGTAKGHLFYLGMHLEIIRETGAYRRRRGPRDNEIKDSTFYASARFAAHGRALYTCPASDLPDSFSALTCLAFPHGGFLRSCHSIGILSVRTVPSAPFGSIFCAPPAGSRNSVIP
jgi:hypothetical protein